MAAQRAAKIQRFRRKKELEQNLGQLYQQVQKEHVDDEVKVRRSIAFHTLPFEVVDPSLIYVFYDNISMPQQLPSDKFVLDVWNIWIY